MCVCVYGIHRKCLQNTIGENCTCSILGKKFKKSEQLQQNQEALDQANQDKYVMELKILQL